MALISLPPPGGIAYYGALLANALARQGHTMLVVTEGMRGFDFDRHLQVACVRKRSLASLPHPAAYREIVQQVRSFAPHVVHDTAGNAFKWSFGLWPLLAREWPLLITEHDPRPHPGMGGLFAQFTRLIARRAARHFIVHGRNCRQALLDTGVRADKISINRHGIFETYDHKRHAGVQEDKHAVLFFGELRPNKGIYRLLDIARRVRAAVPQVKFIVAGRRTRLPSARARRKVARTVAAWRVETGFEVHERYIPDEEVEILMRRCALVILPYEEASQTGVLPVAFAFGKPVVAYDVGDLGESIVPDETSVLVRAADEDAFARAITVLILDPERRHTLGRRAQAWAREELAWEAIAQRTMVDYERLLAPSTELDGHGKKT
ncbi:MAG: glycosyltransferase family 4 protein [bacterium]